MHIVAMVATFNEARFIAGLIEHFASQGVSVYLIDHGSTDETVEIARHYLGAGLLGIESLPRERVFRLRTIMERKEELAATLEADWFIHCDADEIRLGVGPDQTIAQSIEIMDEQGFNAADFQEFTFVPTREQPDHDHSAFRDTMRWYHPFLPFHPHRRNVWKRQKVRVDLAWAAGHCVQFPGIRVSPQSMRMKHYLFLSSSHALGKYGQRNHDRKAVEGGWHGWRADLRLETIDLPSETELLLFTCDAFLDASGPWDVEVLQPNWRSRRLSSSETISAP